MRSRSKVLLAFGAACLSTAVLASGAMAHDKHRERGKMHIKGTNALKVEVRGLIQSITPPAAPGGTGSIVLTAGAGPGLTWTCITPAGADLSMFTNWTLRVKAVCRSTADGLVLTKLRHKDKGDKVKVEARGLVSAISDTSITVQPGTGLPDVTCAIGLKTKIKGAPIVPLVDTVKIECKSKNGVLTAKKIKKKVAKVEAKGALTIGIGTVTVGAVTCAVPNPLPLGMVLPAAGSIVEIKCLGTPPVLAKIELEDDDDDD